MALRSDGYGRISALPHKLAICGQVTLGLSSDIYKMEVVINMVLSCGSDKIRQEGSLAYKKISVNIS